MGRSFTSLSSADDVFLEESFSIKLTDDDGKDLTDPLFGDVVFYFDSKSDELGMEYKLKAMLSLSIVPSNLIITSSTGGCFNVNVKFTGLESWLAEAVMDISLSSDEESFHALIDSEGKHYFMDGATLASFNPGVLYKLSIKTTQGVIQTIPPEAINDITVTFEAQLESGYHNVTFMSEGEVVESYIVSDGYVITDLPVVSRSGYSFIGWFTSDGREIVVGYVVSPGEGDILANAAWDKNGEGFPLYLVGGLVGVFATLFLLLLILVKRRKEEEQ